MGEPRRIQLSRRKGWRMPEGAVKVDRSTCWGNPFAVGETIDRESDLWPYIAAAVPGGVRAFGALEFTSLTISSAQLAVDLFSCWFLEQPGLTIRAFAELPGRDLACWCKIGAPCHGDWLLGCMNGAQDA